jgi:hypothetical protein
MNMSEIEIMFHTGVGVVVHEQRGILNVIVSLPPYYNETFIVSTYVTFMVTKWNVFSIRTGIHKIQSIVTNH